MNLPVDALSGRLQLRCGRSLPTIRSSRREWAATLGRGRPAAMLPQLLSSVYTLCGDAHRLACQHAVDAANGIGFEATPAVQQALQVDTLREQLRRLWLDWPAALAPGMAVDMSVLAGCAVLHAAGPVEASRSWVEQHVLGMSADDWLQQWQASPMAFVTRWAAQGATLPARLLHPVRALALGLRSRPVPLHAHASAIEIERLAHLLRGDVDFALGPTWRSHTAETGPWTRLADPHSVGADSPYGNAWMRLAARVADIAQLVRPGGSAWLAQGSQIIQPGEGVGWCEMARGLLVHWVCVDAEQQVSDCRVIAPTEWNFHPFGAVARSLSLLPADVPAARVRLLAAAYDPCVVIDIETTTESGHA